MKKHQFTLILAGVPEITPLLADALYEALDGDIEFEMRGGVAFLEVTRTARTLRDAITSAIQAVEGAGVGVRVIRVESEAANTIAKINADLLGTPAGGESWR
jgi:hypothetical protein